MIIHRVVFVGSWEAPVPIGKTPCSLGRCVWPWRLDHRQDLLERKIPRGVLDVHNMLYIWVNYNELTTSSLEIIVSKGNHPQMALIQVSELL